MVQLGRLKVTQPSSVEQELCGGPQVTKAPKVPGHNLCHKWPKYQVTCIRGSKSQKPTKLSRNWSKVANPKNVRQHNFKCILIYVLCVFNVQCNISFYNAILHCAMQCCIVNIALCNAILCNAGRGGLYNAILQCCIVQWKYCNVQFNIALCR